MDWRARWSVCVIVVLGAFNLVVACESGLEDPGQSNKRAGGSSVNEAHTSTKQQAVAKLHELAKGTDRSVEGMQVEYFPNGNFAYVEARLAKSNALDRPVAIDRHLDRKAPGRARKQFLKQVEQRWGAANTDTARAIYDMKKGKTSQFSVEVKEKKTTVDKIVKDHDNAELVSSNGSNATVRATKHAIRELAMSSRVRSVMLAPELEAYSLKGPARYSQADEAFNANGVYASGVKVGTDPVTMYNGCVWDTDHKAFDDATFTYQQVQHCQSDSDCPNCKGSTQGDCKTIDKPGRVTNISSKTELCVWDQEGFGDDEVPHGFWGASRVAQNRKNSNGSWVQRHASEAHIYVANEKWPKSNGHQGHADGLSWLANQGVKLIWRSWGDGAQGYYSLASITDEFARAYEDVTVIAAAGNQEKYRNNQVLDVDQDGIVSREDERVDCQAQNMLCVGGSSVETYGGSTATWDDLTDDHMWEHTQWGNPLRNEEEAWEITEPDVVSQADINTKVANSMDDTDFHGRSGTSSAAPGVTGDFALLYDYRGTPLNYSRGARGCARLSSVIRQNLEEARPTSDPVYASIPPVYYDDGMDLYSAGGLLEAKRLKWLCGEPDNTGTGNPQWVTPDPWEVGEPVQDLNDQNLVTKEQWLKTNNPLAATIWDVGEVDPGDHLRTVITWDNCADGDIVPKMNYDLQVCAMDAGVCLAGSQSLHDTTEGVDMQFSDDYSDVHVRIYRSENDEGCGGVDTQAFWKGYWHYN